MGATSCAAKMGRLSRCVGGGVGLTHNYCDDPFCRNGGAYKGSGLYCHNNNVVSCHKDDAPRVRTVCSDVTRTNGFGCRVTDHYECAGGFPEPFCMLKSTSRDCSGATFTRYPSSDAYRMWHCGLGLAQRRLGAAALTCSLLYN